MDESGSVVMAATWSSLGLNDVMETKARALSLGLGLYEKLGLC